MQKADSKGYAGTADDSGQNDEFTSVSQHSRKPNVVGLPSLSDKVTDEIFKDAPLINGYPAIKKSHMEDVLRKHGYVSIPMRNN